MVQAPWKVVWPFLIKPSTFLQYNPPFGLPGNYSELKTYVYTKTCTWMSIAALFIIVQTQKQPRCPSVGEDINKLLYNQTMEYYSILKRNELSGHEKTQRNLKCTLLSERNQSRESTCHMIPTI